ncbi:MAG TPA: DUF5658 family protein [Gemmatimonadaceae bacterium]|nr:DUF5658 family protein [Gemmatimonadaceae bacterium]
MAIAQSGDGAWTVRAFFGNAAFVLFSAVQVADGWLTYLGIHAYGIAIEANPLIGWYATLFGVPTALIGAKTVAVVCGAILHLAERHTTVVLLTVGYLVAAIWPWTLVLR